MEPEQKPPRQPSGKDEKYAAALAKMAELDYLMEQTKQPETKHFIPKKKLIYIGVSIALTIITTIIWNIATKNDSPTDSNDSTQQIEKLIKGTRDLQELKAESEQ